MPLLGVCIPPARVPGYLSPQRQPRRLAPASRRRRCLCSHHCVRHGVPQPLTLLLPRPPQGQSAPAPPGPLSPAGAAPRPTTRPARPTWLPALCAWTPYTRVASYSSHYRSMRLSSPPVAVRRPPRASSAPARLALLPPCTPGAAPFMTASAILTALQTGFVCKMLHFYRGWPVRPRHGTRCGWRCAGHGTTRAPPAARASPPKRLLSSNLDSGDLATRRAAASRFGHGPRRLTRLLERVERANAVLLARITRVMKTSRRQLRGGGAIGTCIRVCESNSRDARAVSEHQATCSPGSNAGCGYSSLRKGPLCLRMSG